MLQRLERADLHAELLALAQVAERALEGFFRDAEQLRREHGAAGIEHRVEHDGALVERADDIAVAHRHVAQLDGRGVVAVDVGVRVTLTPLALASTRNSVMPSRLSTSPEVRAETISRSAT